MERKFRDVVKGYVNNLRNQNENRMQYEKLVTVESFTENFTKHFNEST